MLFEAIYSDPITSFITIGSGPIFVKFWIFEFSYIGIYLFWSTQTSLVTPYYQWLIFSCKIEGQYWICPLLPSLKLTCSPLKNGWFEDVQGRRCGRLRQLGVRAAQLLLSFFFVNGRLVVFTHTIHTCICACIWYHDIAYYIVIILYYAYYIYIYLLFLFSRFIIHW